MNTQPTRPRTPGDELRLIRKAIRRLLQNPDNKGALQALRDIRAELGRALGLNTPAIPGPADKSFARSRDFIEP